jgi:hypothetical protein
LILINQQRKGKQVLQNKKRTEEIIMETMMNKKKVQVLARLNVWLEQALLGGILHVLPMRVLYINAANFLNGFVSNFMFCKINYDGRFFAMEAIIQF